MATLKVLHLGSPEGLYGAERWILALVKHLDRSTVNSIVAVIADAQDPRRATLAPLLLEAEKLGIETCAVRAPGRINWDAVRQIRRLIVDRRIDIVHTHFYKSDLIGLLACRNTSAVCVTTPHGWSSQAGLALRIYEAVDRLLFRYFDAVVPLSPDLFNTLRLRGIRGLRYIANGVDLEHVQSYPAPAPIESARWHAAGDFVVGYVGQLIARKGLDVLLRAFSRLDQTKTRLVIVGDGDQREALQNTADALGVASRTEFLGYREDGIALMRAFSLFVLPSRLEGIPRCLMEAMATGTPVLASDIPGSRDLIQHGKNGWLFPLDDDVALASAIDHLSSAHAQRSSAALSARATVEQKFSARRMARDYEELYLQLSHARTP